MENPLFIEVAGFVRQSYPEISCQTLHSTDGVKCLEVRSAAAAVVTSTGNPTPLLRLIVQLDGRFSLEALFLPVDEFQGVCSLDMTALKPALEKMLLSSSNKFCPGIVNYENRFGSVRFSPKSVRVWSTPFTRMDSHQCAVWFQLGRSHTMADRVNATALCQGCKVLERDLHALVESATSRGADAKDGRTGASSSIPLNLLSPPSKAKRMQSRRNQKRQLLRDLEKCESLKVPLNDAQSAELSKVCDIIDSEHTDVLEEIYAEAGEEGEVMKGTWDEDRDTRATFLADQLHNKTGANGNRWSMITLRMALAVFTRSPAAYEALKSFGILQLPSTRSLKHYTGAHLDKPGWAEENIASQYEKYCNFRRSKKEKGQLEPLGEGVLVFDEVKVVAKVCWNSRNHEVYGLALTDDDFASLRDIYDELKSSGPDNSLRSEYMLQFLWRDMSSGFDIIGPYYSLPSSLDMRFTMACVVQTLQLFQVYGFESSAILCDGAATNMSLMKTFMGMRGAFGMKAEGVADRHAVPASIEHPFIPNRRLFFIVCPSHQLKNMINALYSSMQGGTKSFVTSVGVPFGWQAIVDMYGRECERMKANLPRDVKKLRKNFVWRDSWTKLNVHPAKMMQQEEVLTELAKHCLSSPADKANVEATLAYLKACNLLFEQGTLSHDKVTSATSSPLQSIKEGYAYFESWLDGLLVEKPQLSTTSPGQTSFLAWQTWDLLRIVRFGFVAFCEDFVSRHPGYYIAPVRISGSAVETLFSQLKHCANGRLSSVNYSTARATLSLQRSIQADSSTSRKDYRDVALGLAHTPIRRKP